MAAKSLGADIAICSANPLSAQDDIAAFLYNMGLNVYAWRGETESEYQQCIRNVLAFKPVIVTDDGGDLHSMAHQQKAKDIQGGTEETTSGVKRLVALERASRLIVTEVDPIKAIEAKMDGFEVMPMLDAAPAGDIFVTCTGQTCVIRKEHFLKMKDAAILANAGHFDVEIDTKSLHDISSCQPVQINPNIERFDVNGRRLFLLSKGRVVNLVAAEGHPPEVMALSFANQLLSILYIAKNQDKMEVKVHGVPEQIDQDVGSYALDSMGIRIDQMIEEQKRYQQSS
jgi:S-adenosylhomocysteine hydrolase